MLTGGMIIMGNRGIKYIVYAITLCVLWVVIEYLKNRENTSTDAKQNDLSYIVKAPSVLKYAYVSLFIVGIIMFLIFFIFKLKGNSTVTAGHIYFALIISAIGLAVMIFTSRWRVIVSGNQIEIHNLFGKSECVQISEIEKAEIGNKEQIILYRDGKKLITIDGLSDNYDRFEKTLKKNGKL